VDTLLLLHLSFCDPLCLSFCPTSFVTSLLYLSCPAQTVLSMSWLSSL
jgi:hypothetical protein